MAPIETANTFPVLVALTSPESLVEAAEMVTVSTVAPPSATCPAPPLALIESPTPLEAVVTPSKLTLPATIVPVPPVSVVAPVTRTVLDEPAVIAPPKVALPV